MSLLFEPITLRDLTVNNRIWMPPMCQYSAEDGLANTWHLTHYASHAVGGFGLIVVEATGISPRGRITPRCLGLWNPAQAQALAGVVDAIHAQGTAAAVQLIHAGRKASAYWPWKRDLSESSVPLDQGGWAMDAPTDVAFPGYRSPQAMTLEDIADIPQQFARAAQLAHSAGFDAVEIHAAHGYLLHQFLSPLVNTRTDMYGGNLDNRSRLLRECTDAVRAVFPDNKPVFVRVSATDWLPGGLTPEDLAHVFADLASRGVDLADVSTGGLLPAPIPAGPGYQLPHARRIRELTGMPTAAVGMITTPEQAEQVLVEGDADVVCIGRAALRDPHWPLRAAHELGVSVPWPPQYERAQWHAGQSH